MGYKYILPAILLLFSFNTYSQVGIGNIDPDPSSLLEIGEGNDAKGILIPRVNIPNLNSAAPINSPAESLLVYNTNSTSGKGYVYWNGTGWQSFGGSNVKLAHENISFPPKSISNSTGLPVLPILIYSHTITITKPTLVEIKALISVKISRYDTDPVISGKPILYGMLVTKGALFAPSTRIMVSEFKSYTSGPSSSGTVEGYYTLEGNGYIELPVGDHVINMYGAGQGGGSGGYTIIFNQLQGAHFQVIYHN